MTQTPTQTLNPAALFDAPAPAPADLVPVTPPALAPLPAKLAAIDPYAMLQQAMDRGMSLEVIERFMALAERIDAQREAQRRRDAEAAYIRALADLKAEVVSVKKTKRVDYNSRRSEGGAVSYKHATLADIMEAVAEVAARVGLSWNYPEAVLERSGSRVTWVSVTCVLRHVDGHSETLTLGGAPDDSGNKNPMQQVQSAITYLERYALKALLGIAEKDDDDDGRGGPPRGRLPAEYRRDLNEDAAPLSEDATARREQLVNEGQDKSLDGMPALSEWWNGMSLEDRNLVGLSEFGKMKNAALAVGRGAN